jgi:CPA2 family monovalent cation:H+ antiporter-2
MHLDPLLPRLVGALLLVVALSLALRRSGAPTLVVHLMAGMALGPEGLGVLEDREALSRVGEFGVLLLLFFVGMEMSLPRLVAGWRIAIGGTVLQVVVSVAAALGTGALFGWPLGRSVLLGFVVSLSSTAVVVRLLRERGELNTEIGQDVLGILLAQDLAIVPMVMVLGVMTGGGIDAGQLIAQGVAGASAVALVIALQSRPDLLQGPLDRLADDPELRLFGALLFCLGLATLSALAGLSTASGAFLAGLLLSVAGRTEFAHHALDGLRVLLLAVFFAAIGSLLELDFLRENFVVVILLASTALLSNTFINALTLRWLGRPWRHAIVGGAWLSQIGELSFVLAAVGLTSGLIGDFAYRMTLSVIACTLLVSTAWIGLATRLTREPPAPDEPASPPPTSVPSPG